MFRFDLDTCSKCRDLFGAVALFESAVSQNFHLIHYQYNALLYLCTISTDEPSSKALALDYGFRIFDHVVNSDVTPNEATITAVASLIATKFDGDLAPKGVGCGGAYGFDGGAYEGAGAGRVVKVSAEMGIGDKVYAYLHKLRTAVRSVSESTAEIIEGWFCGEAALEVGSVDCCLGAIEEVALKNRGGWHGQGWISKGKWVVCRAKVDSSGQCGSCREQLVTVDIDRPETETFSESVAAMAMEREVRSNFSGVSGPKGSRSWSNSLRGCVFVVLGKKTEGCIFVVLLCWGRRRRNKAKRLRDVGEEDRGLHLRGVVVLGKWCCCVGEEEEDRGQGV
ncbi:Proteinaceous RNase P 3 [Vitis vinifera]|uniref:Proteinaceous RNase P 3 n=1 Tax=Vitis vinifera TaxID=29760 RepID=A0A438JH89_VITVI|nr:Proteinaceous RNase P 3 [Vitis vinifera]